MNKVKDHTQYLKSVERSLFILLFLMVACFFTWSENITITRAIKLLGRNGVLLGIIMLYRKLRQYGLPDTLRSTNSGAMLLYMGYLLLGFASFLWSTNVGVSSLQWFMTCQSCVFAYFFIKVVALLDVHFKGHTIKVYDLLGNTVFYLILIFVIGMWVAPDVFYRLTHGGEEARLGGYIMNPNELGMLAGVGVACLIFNLYRQHRKTWTITQLLILFYALYATGSRSSLIGALLIVGFHVMQSDKKQVKVLIIAGMCAVAPVAIWQVVLKGGDSSRLEEVMSMTGRLPFWQALISEGLPREPLLGFGFMRIDYKEFFQSTHTYPGKMTHNTFMQVLMNLGFVGLTLVLFQLALTVRGVLAADKEKKLMLIGIFIPIVINSMTEFGIFGESNYGILFYQLIIFSIYFREGAFMTFEEKVKLKMMKGASM
jgi:exopolysaccharide production protein ExoQ